MEEALMEEPILRLIEQLCAVVPDRRPGGRGNDEAVALVADRLGETGWDVALPEFEVLNWVGGDAVLSIGADSVPLAPSPYGKPADVDGPVRVVAGIEDLSANDLAGSILVVTGGLASEPLTPKAFPFYASAEHTRIIATLERVRPAAIVAVTGTYPELCGALDPFPWIEDGDFDIPAAAVRPADAGLLLKSEATRSHVSIEARRIPSTARNIVARRGPSDPRLVVCAHIDSKPGTPGAVDNAAGVAALVILAERLAQHEDLPLGVELLAVNGEDHFAAPGEVAWLAANEGRLDAIELFMNIDGAGYRRGRTAFSFYNVGEERADGARRVFAGFDDLIEGPPWFQSDHAIFAHQGRPAMAMTTEFVDQMLAELFHATTDTPDQVEPARIVGIADALEALITRWEASAWPSAPGSGGTGTTRRGDEQEAR
jgi:aminopeptidase YwaD